MKTMNLRSLLPCTILILLLASQGTLAQLCTNNKDSLYGLTTTGSIVGINTNNAGGTLIRTAASDTNSNALGYSSINGLFYFFNKNGSVTQGQQFVSFNAVTGAMTTLATSPIPAGYIIRSGCVNTLGSTYYTLDTSHVPGVHSNFYGYNIGSNTWTLITSSFVDASNNPIPAIDTLISGDMAFDGNGNLWMVCSSKWNWALYEIKAPVPTTAVAKVTVTTIIPITANPAGQFGKVSFTGVAFNSVGNMYLAFGNNAFGNKLYQLTNPVAGSLTLIGSLTADYGGDLSSCSYPTAVLPVTWLNFNAAYQGNAVDLSWTANEDASVTGYSVEYSSDGRNWQVIGNIPKDITGTNDNKAYSYASSNYATGENYYRIEQETATGRISLSPIKFITTSNDKSIHIGPNPTTNTIYFYNRNSSSKSLAQVYDRSGRLLYSTVISKDQQSMDISRLGPGYYLLRLVSPSGNEAPQSFEFVKM